MKIWLVAASLLLGSLGSAQLNRTLTPEDRQMSERVFRSFTKAASGTKLEVRRLNGRDIEVSGAGQICVIDAFQEDVSRWRSTVPASDLLIAPTDKGVAIQRAREFGNSYGLELSRKISATPDGGAWTLRFEKVFNGYATPVADAIQLDGSGRVVSLEREGLGFRPRPIKIVVDSKDAVDIARNKFSEQFGEVQTAACEKTSYEFMGASEIDGRSMSPMAPRRLRLSHTVKITAPGRTASVLIDVIDGEIVRDEIVALPGVKIGLATEAPPEKNSRENSVLIFLFSVVLLGMTVYWYGRFRRAQTLVDSDEL